MKSKSSQNPAALVLVDELGALAIVGSAIRHAHKISTLSLKKLLTASATISPARSSHSHKAGTSKEKHEKK